jgi:hypothetical protein
MVQHETNARSSEAMKQAVGLVREGVIGDVYMSRGLCYKWRDTIGRTPVEPVPAGVNYDLWLGPAPKREYTRNRFHYNFHWFWAYGNGDIGNQGVHQMDTARWLLGVKYPTKVSAMGGHYMFDDDQETPNTMTANFEFDEGVSRGPAQGPLRSSTAFASSAAFRHCRGIGLRARARRDPVRNIATIRARACSHRQSQTGATTIDTYSFRGPCRFRT